MSFEFNDDTYPGQAVAFIITTWADNTTTGGSGFLVGRNDVLTASHVIYDEARGGLADTIEVYFSFDPDDAGHVSHLTAKEQYFTDFDPNGDGHIASGDGNPNTLGHGELDIALLTLDAPLGDQYGWFGIDWSFSEGVVNKLGFPDAYGSNLTFDSGFIAANSTDYFYDVSNIETHPGDSGGVYYYDNGSGPFAVGVHSSGSQGIGGAATEIGGHEYWLRQAIIDNDSFIGGSVDLDLGAWLAANETSAKATAAAYQLLLNGVPSVAGFTFLIDNNNATNFGAGPGPVFNAENIFINVANALVQGNATAAANFNTLIGGQATLIGQVTTLYLSLVPPASRTNEGLAFFTRPESLAFYTAVATERGVEGGTGPAVVALGSMANVMVRNDVPGIGDSVNDLFSAASNNTSVLPAAGDVFTHIEIADGTAFDADDAAVLSAAAAFVASSEVYAGPTDISELAFASSVSLVGLADGYNGGVEPVELAGVAAIGSDAIDMTA